VWEPPNFITSVFHCRPNENNNFTAYNTDDNTHKTKTKNSLYREASYKLAMTVRLGSYIAIA